MMEIRGYPKWQRVYAGGVFGAVAIFLLWLYWNNRSTDGAYIGLVMVGVSCWLTAYWLSLPRLLGVVTPRGIDYINEDLALLFCYRCRHIDWDNVTSIDTFERSGKGGPVMATVVKARDSRNPAKVRTFNITSQHIDYYRFIAYLDSVVDRSALASNSLPLNAALLQRKLHVDRLHKLAVLFATSVLLLLFVYFTKR